MEDLLSALADPRRLWLTVTILSSDKPLTQEELRRALSADEASAINPGSMTRLLAPLFQAGLISRVRPRGAISVVHPGLTRGLILAAADLQQAVEGNAQLTAGRNARQVQKLAAALTGAAMDPPTDVNEDESG